MKRIALLTLILLAMFLAACQTMFIDKSQPWKDDAGHWHTQAVCGNHTHTTYASILADDDERDSSGTSWVSYHHYKTYKRSSHTYVTIPLQSTDWECTYV